MGKGAPEGRVKKTPTKKAGAASSVPTEDYELRRLAGWLDKKAILWCHVANEGQNKWQYRAKMANRGVKPGVPDVLIFSPPPKVVGARGVAIELKRVKGGTVSRYQKDWLDRLEQADWLTHIAKGHENAIIYLKELGY